MLLGFFVFPVGPDSDWDWHDKSVEDEEPQCGRNSGAIKRTGDWRDRFGSFVRVLIRRPPIYIPCDFYCDGKWTLGTTTTQPAGFKHPHS